MNLTDREAAALEYDWPFWARPQQLPPSGNWTYWLLSAGRGFGKTRTGAEWVRSIKEHCSPIALVAPTAGDARDVMVEGPAGLLAIAPPWDRPVYEPSKRRVTWENGSQATLFSADEPERLRGPQHMAAWCDELGAWRYPGAWDMLQFGLRLGAHPRCVITTTPRPVKLVRDLLRDPDCAVTTGSTYDNKANLAASFYKKIVSKYEGTRLGRQELMAELLEDVPGALWNSAMIDAGRVELCLPLKRIVVAIDPAVTSGEDADETGIIVCGVDVIGEGYVLEDLSCRESPDQAMRIAVSAYRRHRADRIIAEINNGGEMIESLLRTVDPNIPFRAVRATRGKVVRAEPVSALYEQGRVHHVGYFPQLEEQMCSFTTDFDRTAAGYSPDRLDALVWGLTDLMLDDTPRPSFG